MNQYICIYSIISICLVHVDTRLFTVHILLYVVHILICMINTFGVIKILKALFVELFIC